MLITQCTVHIYPANNNHNVQLGVAKECWVAKLVLRNAFFTRNCTTSNEMAQFSYSKLSTAQLMAHPLKGHVRETLIRVFGVYLTFYLQFSF